MNLIALEMQNAIKDILFSTQKSYKYLLFHNLRN